MESGIIDRYYTLSQISGGIRDAIYSKFGDWPVWIAAEISDLSVRKGHCYLTLVEKPPGTASPICELRGIIWANRYERISKTFREATGTELSTNTGILFRAVIKYDIKWGLSLVIEDIEPRYTIGLIQQEREQTVAKLKAEGVYDSNRQLAFPAAPMRVAVISAKDSRGFEDFEEKLQKNPYKYLYKVSLFPSLLQGDRAAANMVEQLIDIFSKSSDYDVVVIVRGGGGSVDLNCFNDYKLSRAVARFPLPVITGIGHTANISVVDEVAYSKRITPTDAASFLVEQTHQFELRLNELSSQIQGAATDLIIDATGNLEQLSNEFRMYVKDKLNTEIHLLSRIAYRLKRSGMSEIDRQKVRLINQTGRLGSGASGISKIEKERLDSRKRHFILAASGFIRAAGLSLDQSQLTVGHLNPVNILKRGYSITSFNGKPVKSSTLLKPGDQIKTTFYEGVIESEVKKS